MKVRCKTQHCLAEGEGRTLEEAIHNVDHAIALSRSTAPGVPKGCPGGFSVEYEVTEEKKIPTSEKTDKKSDKK